jgi:hypothetical protein
LRCCARFNVPGLVDGDPVFAATCAGFVVVPFSFVVVSVGFVATVPLDFAAVGVVGAGLVELVLLTALPLAWFGFLCRLALCLLINDSNS